MGLHYDNSTMIIYINCSINKKSDSHFKIISLVKVDFCLQKTPECQKNLLHKKLNHHTYISLACHELSITSLLLDYSAGLKLMISTQV